MKTRAQTSVNDSERRAMDNIPEFSEGGGVTEYDHLKGHRARIEREHAADVTELRRILQRVADFNFLDTLDATPTPKAREAYTQLMVDVRLVLRPNLRKTAADPATP